jgi:2-octaprenyl-6-methoxyphenol hydroxylase
MGWIVENRHLRRALYERLAEAAAVQVLAPANIAATERGEHGVSVTLADGGRILAPLIASCEGRGAALRQSAGINVLSWRYPQTAIVCTVGHEHPHGCVAHEKFLPGGPFAILPMTDDEDGTHRSSIVWTERPPIAASVIKLDERDFTTELGRRLGSHPLGLLHAGRYVERRLALVGDAAHGIHPIAGQGYNLGTRDVAALAETVVDAWRLGLDHGAADVLARYERWRRFDNTTLVASTDLLNWLFSNNLPPLRLVRDLGLAIVDRLPVLQRPLMRHAMGVLGDLPRLARGEKL